MEPALNMADEPASNTGREPNTPAIKKEWGSQVYALIIKMSMKYRPSILGIQFRTAGHLKAKKSLKVAKGLFALGACSRYFT